MIKYDKIDIERKPAYFNKILMGCANYKKGTEEFAGFQVMCCDCTEDKCPFENNLPIESISGRTPEACLQCHHVHNEDKCPKCNYCWVCDA